LFLYTLGQYSILLWLPSYAQAQLGASPDQAGRLVAMFWTGLFVAQLLVAWWVVRVGVQRLVVIAGVTTCLFSLPLWMSGNVNMLPLYAFAWGLANLGLLKIVLSFGTQQVSVPTPRLVSTLLLGATMGTAVSPWVTSRIVLATDNFFILQFGSLCYAALAVLLIIAVRRHRLAAPV
jgi:TsgA-like MFS transporter